MNLRSTALVITTISHSSNNVLMNYSQQCRQKDADLIIVGDLRTPEDFQLSGADFLSHQCQKDLPFKLGILLPDNNYAKKNLGYLKAMLNGNTRIIETDDDNIPYETFWKSSGEQVSGYFAKDTSWINVFKHFSKKNIWPRGFALNHVLSEKKFTDLPPGGQYFCPIQQRLVDDNPDVDAIYRLTQNLPVYFEDNHPLILGYNSICPFNSQNTIWFKEAFPLLYLPSYCSFRMTDIWRSFIAQRICWTCNWQVSFHAPTAFQQRNAHDLLNDLTMEVPGYVNNEIIMEKLLLLNLPHGEKNIFSNLKTCYTMMVDEGYIDAKEVQLLDAWIDDVKNFS